jgi:hypothetical protein
MRITKRQLQQIIHEASLEEEHPEEVEDTEVLGHGFASKKSRRMKGPSGLSTSLDYSGAGMGEGILRLTESHLRRLIQSLLREQVVGYKAPAKTYDDPMDDDSGGLSGSSAGSSGTSGDDDGGYETVGSMGVDVSLDDDSTQTQQASAENVKSLTVQRQQALNKGDTGSAEQSGTQLSTARKMRS